MNTLTLLARASNSGQLKQVEDLLKTAFEDLDVEVNVLGKQVGGWVQVSVSGEDEGVAKSYISKEIGTCPTSLSNVQKYSVLKGYISKVNNDQQDLIIDVGVFEPRLTPASVPLASLQAHLFDGRNIPLLKISEAYGLCIGVPLSVKVVSEPIKDDDVIQAELSDEQVQSYLTWKKSLLERLVALSASYSDLETVLERLRLNRDVIGIESLGMFEQSLTCKLGTNAAGLIPKIGRYLRNSRFIVFNPWKTLGLQG